VLHCKVTVPISVTTQLSRDTTVCTKYGVETRKIFIMTHSGFFATDDTDHASKKHAALGLHMGHEYNIQAPLTHHIRVLVTVHGQAQCQRTYFLKPKMFFVMGLKAQKCLISLDHNVQHTSADIITQMFSILYLILLFYKYELYQPVCFHFNIKSPSLLKKRYGPP
jgi:hypothetical protein